MRNNLSLASSPFTHSQNGQDSILDKQLKFYVHISTPTQSYSWIRALYYLTYQVSESSFYWEH